MKITFLGHSCFVLQDKNIKILIDPFIADEYKGNKDVINIIEDIDYILLTHGHNDHIGDVIEIAKKTNATIISNFEICNWLNSIGINNCIDMNVGGTYLINEDIKITMVMAQHSSSIAYKNETVYGGLACGYIIQSGSNTVYHFGDTEVFLDMELINKLYHPNIGLIPVGGRYTMDIEKAAYACNNFFNFETIIPMHYNTFKAIEINIEEFTNSITKGNVVALDIAQTINI